jgi:hypothetical protein
LTISGASKELIEASYATASWAKHKSAMKSLETFENSHGGKHDWPLSTNRICEYTSWALTENGLKSSTVRSYLSSIAMAHKLSDMEHNCSNFIVNLLLRGAENLCLYKPIVRNTRKVMTLPLLKIIGHYVATSNWSENSKLVFWSACVVAFFGSFRLGEILPAYSDNFNPDETLLWRDVNFNSKDSVLINIKIDKNKNQQGSFVDLFRFDGHNCCPVSSLRAMHDLNPSPNSPVFSFSNGLNLTVRKLNSTLHVLLYPALGESAFMICGHSFRAGLPSAMANDPEAVKDFEICQWGRWSSESYLLYTRLKFKQKQALFRKITEVLNK